MPYPQFSQNESQQIAAEEAEAAWGADYKWRRIGAAICAFSAVLALSGCAVIALAFGL